MKYWLSVLFCGMLITAHTQECQLVVRGTIYDEFSTQPLDFAEVYLQEGETGTVSDEAGNFVLENLCPGDYHLRISHVTCHPERVFLQLRADTVLVIRLQHHAESIEGVVVTSQRQQRAGQSQQTLTRQELEQSAGKSLGELVSGIAGVSSIKSGSGIVKPVIQGLTGNRVAILNNGLVQAGQQWGVDHAPEIDPFTADRVTVLKGVESIAYGGNTLGGAILVEPGNINNDPHLHGAAQYVLASQGRQQTVSARVEKTGAWAAWRLVGTFKEGGDHRSPDYWLRNTGVRERNVAAQVQKNFNDHWFNTVYYSFFHTELGILRGAHIGNITDLQEAIGRPEPFFTQSDFSNKLEEPRQAVTHHLLKYNSKYFFNASQSLQFTYGGQLNRRQEYDVRRGDRSNQAALDLQLLAHFVDVQYLDESSKIRKKMGVQFRYNDNNNKPGTGVLPLIPDYNLYQPGAYAIWDGGSEKNSWQLGGRYDFTALRVAAISRDLPRRVERFSHHFHQFSLGAGVQNRVGKSWVSKFNVGLTRRTPEVNELYSAGLHQGVSGIEEGRSDLQPELSFKGIWTNVVHIGDRFLLESSLYYQLIDNFIYLQPEQEFRLTIRGAFPVFAYAQTPARIAGLDLTAKYKLGEQLEWLGRYALVRGQDRGHDQPLVYLPADNLMMSLTYRTPDWGVLKSPNLRVSGNYVFEQTRLLPEQDLLAPPPAYFLLNMSLGTELNWKQKTLHVSVQAENLLNIRYRDYLNRLRYYADEEGRNIRLNLRYEF
ncbi:MAG: TonB-dependent receptor [Bacteroidetes bacterium]|nr:MAG: TonB-dependent receptor [Bacteroidota bacterium]PTM12777.1 MAG: TonB-dependent receptor [Bacteroidota bacterium]